MNDRLYRSRDDRLLAGVAGGLAEHWDADPSLVRLAWALLVIFTGGIALLVYIVMAIVVPEGEAMPIGAPPAAPGATPQQSEDWRAERTAQRATAREARRAARADGGPRGGRTGALIVGGLLVLFGVWFLLEELIPWLDTDLFWPAALVVIGVAVLAMAFRPRTSTPLGPGPTQPTHIDTTGTTGVSGTPDAGAPGAVS